MNGRSKLIFAIILVSLLFASQQIMSAQALSSLTPEGETAESSIIMQTVISSFGFANSAEECNNPDFLDELPDRVLFDDEGNRASIDQFSDIANTIQCLIFVDEDGNEAPVGTGEIGSIDFIDLIRGNTYTFSNGREIDATKQSVRASFISGVSGRMALFLADVDVVGLAGDDRCQVVSDLVFDGETVELRYAAFDALYDDLFFNVGDSCYSPGVSDEEVLLDAAAGSFEAALTLVLDWQIEALTEIFILEENLFGLLDFIDAEMDRFEDMIRVNREEAPLIALAAAPMIELLVEVRLQIFA